MTSKIDCSLRMACRGVGCLLTALVVIVLVGMASASAQTGWHYAWVNGKCYRTAASMAPPAPTQPYWHRTNDPKCRSVPVTVSRTPFGKR